MVSWACDNSAADVIALPLCLPSSGHLRQRGPCASLGMESPLCWAESVIVHKR